jgi:superfamily II DNA or RNA helicase
MDKPKLIGDAVEHYGRLALGRLAILAATSIQHSQHLAEAFRAAGIPAAHCDGTTPREERRRILKSLPAREIMVLCQVDICGKGWDCREVSCGIDDRPTQSQARAIQFWGRILRCCEGKHDAILLCHSGNVHRHGLPDEPRVWSLEGLEHANASGQNFSVSTCRACFATFRPGPLVCPYCGAAIIRRERTIEVEDGQLEEIRREQKAEAIAKWQARATVDKKREEWEKLRAIAEERKYKRGWLPLQYKIKFGNWPPRGWMQEKSA